jgi:hypothetical protein
VCSGHQPEQVHTGNTITCICCTYGDRTAPHSRACFIAQHGVLSTPVDPIRTHTCRLANAAKVPGSGPVKPNPGTFTATTDIRSSLHTTPGHGRPGMHGLTPVQFASALLVSISCAFQESSTAASDKAGRQDGVSAGLQVEGAGSAERPSHVLPAGSNSDLFSRRSSAKWILKHLCKQRAATGAAQFCSRYSKAQPSAVAVYSRTVCVASAYLGALHHRSWNYATALITSTGIASIPQQLRQSTLRSLRT